MYITSILTHFILSQFFLTLFIKSWAGFTETSSTTFDGQIQEKLIISTFRTSFSEIFSSISTICEVI